MKYRVLEAATFLSLAIVAGSFIYTAPEPQWRTEIVANNTYGKFAEIDSYGDEVGIVYVDSVESGLSLAEKTFSTSLLSFSPGFSGDWDKQVVTNDLRSFYPSLESSIGKPFIAYRSGDLGNEEFFFASRTNGNWTSTELDNVTRGGVRVGMYSSISFLNGQPVVFYHSPAEGLKMASRSNGNWNIQNLNKDQRWFIDTAKCRNKILVAYRDRNTNQLKLGEYNGEWSTRNTSINIRSDIEVETENCRPHYLYSSQNRTVTYRSPEETRKFSYSYISRMSLTLENSRPHITYLDEGKGLIYATKTNGEWRNKTIKNGSETGNYNDITVDSLGNIHIAYTAGDTVYHSIYNSGTVQKINSKTDTARKAFIGLAWLLTILTIWKKDVVPRILQKIRRFRS